MSESPNPVTKTPVNWTELEAPWSRFELEDGTVISVRVVMLDANRTDEFDSDGNPIYQVAVRPVLRVEVPEDLKRSG